MGDREWPLDEARLSHLRGVRVRLVTGYNELISQNRKSLLVRFASKEIAITPYLASDRTPD
jgi:hypothetical protein